MTVLVFIEHQANAPTPASLDLLRSARDITDDDVVALVIGSGTEARAGLEPADRLLTVSGADYADYRSDLYIAALAEAVRHVNPDLVLISNSYVGIDLAAGVASRAAIPLVTYCTALTRVGAELEAHSLAYGGKLDATVRVALPAVVGVNAGALQGAASTGRGEIEPFSPMPPASRFRFVKAIEDAAADVDIRTVDKLVCVGRGIGEEDDISVARELADVIGGEVAGSRPVIDLGWLPRSRQVGKSGLKVKPKLYIALGVSGAPEHLEGMSEAGYILAVNSDPAAPIFDVAHVGTTCDIGDLVPALLARLGSCA